MEIRVRVARVLPSGDGVADERNDTEDWTEAFADWIAEDRRPGRSAVVRRVREAPADGGMSSGPPAWLSFAVDSGSFLTGVVGVWAAFRASLPRRAREGARLVVEHGGRRYVINEETHEDTIRVARALGLAPAPSEEEPGRAPS
ncbi:effector-associated constant component EACC1 [Streptomyces cinerochromogenes]|uniref:effector-associated constant component EACC1 n=1 Tax=Streptomyces cinerochromogenes TaxID=66422 RepID=UPI0033B9DD81